MKKKFIVWLLNQNWYFSRCYVTICLIGFLYIFICDFLMIRIFGTAGEKRQISGYGLDTTFLINVLFLTSTLAHHWA